MRKTIVSGLVITVIALTAFKVNASDVRYPASNFQPKVVYMDENVAKTSAKETTEATDSQYPAANFQPKVIYPEAAGAQQTSAKAQPVATEEEVDPKYPAAHFKPRVIYP